MISLSSKHRKTLNKIFENPVRSDMAWRDIEAMFYAMGADIEEARGSRVYIELNGIPSVFHRPHPQKETDKGALKSVREFLIKAGVKDA